jgi:hypothetical protein
MLMSANESNMAYVKACNLSALYGGRGAYMVADCLFCGKTLGSCVNEEKA